MSMKDYLPPSSTNANIRTLKSEADVIPERHYQTENSIGQPPFHALLRSPANVLMLQRVIGNQAVQRQLQQDSLTGFWGKMRMLRERMRQQHTAGLLGKQAGLLAEQMRLQQTAFVVDSKRLEAIKKNSKGDKECVAIAQDNVKGIGLTSQWKAGVSLMTFPNISKGTVIATFNKDGKYPNKDSGNHVAIFLEYVKDKSGKIVGILVLDQWDKRKAGERTLMFISEQEMQKYLKDHPPSVNQASLNSNAANNMYVVENPKAVRK